MLGNAWDDIQLCVFWPPLSNLIHLRALCLKCESGSSRVVGDKGVQSAQFWVFLNERKRKVNVNYPFNYLTHGFVRFL